MRWNQRQMKLNRTNRITVKVKPVIPAKPIINKKIKYVINDPSTPSLVKEVSVPAISPSPRFTVLGYKGGGFEPNTVEGQAANVYVTVSNAINSLNVVTDNKLTGWAATANLSIKPRAGRKLNAYYDRRTLSFFYYNDKEKNKDLFTSDSSDIVSHELGHAILDFYRPDLWNVASLETWAFHEAFGDLTSMMSIMTYDEVLQYVYDQTGGDLRKYNLISGIAEDFGRVVSQYDTSRNRNWLRNAINEFKYINPTTLPDDTDDGSLSSEPHSFSRVMLGSFYDLLVSFYEVEKSRNVEPIQAMKNARNVLSRYTMAAIQKTPNNSHFYTGFANTMLKIDEKAGSPWQSVLLDSFSSRNLIDITALSMQDHKEHHKCCGVRLCDCLPLSAQSVHHSNPLYDVEVQLPSKDYSSIINAKKMLDYLHRTDSVSDAEDAPFELCDGKLVRSFFMCGCGGFRNENNPTQPEYKKPYKPKNNAGCCGSCKSKENVVVNKTIRRGCFTRYKVN